MRNHIPANVMALVVALIGAFAGAPALRAQSPQQTAPAAPSPGTSQTPDLSGVWLARRFPGTFTKPEPPMRPEAAARYQAVRGHSKLEVDPDVIYCAPPGPARILLHHYPFEIVQLPGRVLILFEYDHVVQQIYTDGREHPQGADLDHTWMGHSIGKWDGDALVVDTVGMNDKGWLDEVGHPHSDALHLIERFRKADPNTLQIDLTFDDPKDYTKTWTGQMVFLRKAGWEIMEHTCADNFLNKPKIDEGTSPAGID